MTRLLDVWPLAALIITSSDDQFRILYHSESVGKCLNLTASQLSEVHYLHEVCEGLTKTVLDTCLESVRRKGSCAHVIGLGHSNKTHHVMIALSHLTPDLIAHIFIPVIGRTQVSLIDAADDDSPVFMSPFVSQSIFEQISEGLFLLDLSASQQLVVRWMNPIAERYMDLTNKQAYRRTLQELMPIEFQAQWAHYEQEFVQSGASYRFTASLVLRDQQRYFDITLTHIKDLQDKLLFVVGLARDVTKVTIIEEERTRKAQEFRTLIENSPDMIIRYDKQARRLYVNQAYLQITGLSSEECIGRTPLDIDNVGNQAERLTAFIKNVATSAVSGSIVMHFQAVDEKIHYFEMHAVPEFDGAGNVTSVLVIGRDITERYESQNRLFTSEQAFRTLVENSPDAIARYDPEGRRVFVNKALVELLGKSAEELVGKSPLEDNLGGDDSRGLYNGILRVAATKNRETLSICLNTKHFGKRYLDLILTPEFDRSGDINNILVVSRDITAHKEIEEQLYRSEQTYRTLVENSPDIICRYDCDRRLIYANPSLAKLVGKPVSELLGISPATARQRMVEHGRLHVSPQSKVDEALFEVLKTGRNLSLETKILRQDGALVTALVRFVAEYDRDGELVSVLAVARDISDIHEYRQQVNRLSYYDVLTGLPNRTHFNDKVNDVLTQAGEQSYRVGLMMIDLDQFKNINDSLGHGSGDYLLSKMAERLLDKTGDGDIVARLGGDEFAILMPDNPSRDIVRHKGQSILDVIREPLLVNDREISVTASIGACIYPDDCVCPSDFVSSADSALFHAKDSGRNTLCFYHSGLTIQVRERLELENDLRRALARNEMQLFFQPQIHLHSGEVIGAEALIRWQHSERGLISPDRFIHIAEENGFIVELGEWIMRQACMTALQLNRDRSNPLVISVNLSPRQFADPEISAMVLQALSDTGCHPHWIELEITEGILMDRRYDVMKSLQDLKEPGISIAIDDFGTGYSSLGYLTRFPIDTLKIDQSFVSQMLESQQSAVLIRTIISMASSLSMHTIAEGVETSEQAYKLATMGCEQAQGFYYGRPMSITQFERYLQRQTNFKPIS
ncbi:bifunctional diguanylate cyclase/phosphodiesterase [Gynuella sunshinyii]|uniref:bifunctional diguanylate cyclase/phosphodiesterase n=1 Tax=Gynuella sunshinyii TaxID=1445505 RepID=UPI0014703074|nr:bifunctional diguanylate cyclase/phosphodiesterase [Gynuella sunshinyii]